MKDYVCQCVAIRSGEFRNQGINRRLTTVKKIINKSFGRKTDSQFLPEHQLRLSYKLI